MRLLYGELSAKNDPAHTDGLFAFPVTPGGPRSRIRSARYYPLTLLLSYVLTLWGRVVNILKFLRLDLVRRITYLDHPDVSKWAVLASVKFDF